jgi:hypothetical protein
MGEMPAKSLKCYSDMYIHISRIFAQWQVLSRVHQLR